MLYVPWTEEYTTKSDSIDFRCIYESNANLIMQNRSNYESTDQTSIDQAMNVLEQWSSNFFLSVPPSYFLTLRVPQVPNI